MSTRHFGGAAAFRATARERKRALVATRGLAATVPAATVAGVAIDAASHPRAQDEISKTMLGESALSEPILVLNKNWLPIRVSTVRRALVLVWKDLARIIEPDNYALYDFNSWADLSVPSDERCVRTVSLSIRVPEIIVLRHCDRFKKPEVVFSRRNLFRRDRNSCQYCGNRFPTEDLTIDHVVPRALGGVSSWSNCVVACHSCNARKGARPLEQSGMRLLRAPRKPPPRMAFSLPLGRRKASWEQFVSEAYWNVELAE